MEMSKTNLKLDLRAGEIVEVRSQEEILATLDDTGRLDAMPFMPEMLQFCGKRYRVYKRADKTCDTVSMVWRLRRVRNAVHLAGVRCDGRAHESCDASCLIFWREAWLKRVDPDVVKASDIQSSVAQVRKSSTPASSHISKCTLEVLQRATRGEQPLQSDLPAAPIFSCQATDLQRFTINMPWWDFRQYYRDIRSGNLSRGIAIAKGDRILELLLGSLDVIRALLIGAFNRIQGIRKGVA